MTHKYDKNDYYESRPFLFILIGAFGFIAPLVLKPGMTFFQTSYLSSILILSCAFKIMKMRKTYRRQRLPIK